MARKRGNRRYKIALLVFCLLLFLVGYLSAVNKVLALPEAPSIHPLTNQISQNMPDIDKIRNLLVQANLETPAGPTVTKLAIPQGRAVMRTGGQTFDLTPNGDNYIQIGPDGIAKASHNNLVGQLQLPTKPIYERIAVTQGSVWVSSIFEGTRVLTAGGDNFSQKFTGGTAKDFKISPDLFVSMSPDAAISPLGPIGQSVGTDPANVPKKAADPVLAPKNFEAVNH